MKPSLQALCALTFTLAATPGAYGATYYVDAARTNDGGAGTSWATAKRTIQAAVNLTHDGDTVLVTNGVYNSGTTAMPEYLGWPSPEYTLRNRVVINRPITVRSVNGPEVTVIEGSGTNFFDTVDAVRCVYIGRGALEGFTLRGGATYNYVAGRDEYNNFDFCGGGVKIRDGGMSGTRVDNCVIRDCMAYEGGGAYSEYFGNTLNNCTLTGNTAYFGGGARFGILNNCILSGNTAYRAGGGFGGPPGLLNNCTLSGNTAPSGGGASYGQLRNCVVWGNNRPNGALDNYSGSTFEYSCTAPLPSSGTGNTDAAPQFVGEQDLRLRSCSPCLDTGGNAYMTLPTDLLGNPRIQNGTVDMGAYEGGVPASAPPVFDPPSGTCFTNSLAVAIACATDGTTIRYTLDGSEPTEGSDEYTEPLAITTAATVAARAFAPGLLSGGARAAYHRPTVRFVDASRPDDSGDGFGWATAKRTIQAAVDLADAGDTVLVTNGIYGTGVTLTPGYTLGNRVVITNMITVRSVNGPTATVIAGAGMEAYGTTSAVRCVYMSNGVLDGFALRGGATYGAGQSDFRWYDRSGGGLNLYDAAAGTMVSNCVIQSCMADDGGGAYCGTLNHCTLSGNTAHDSGGGAKDGTLNNCTISGNTADSGGGAASGWLNDCTLSGNTAVDGGGYSDSFPEFGTLNNCTISGNTAEWGGGAFYGQLRNCVVWGNKRPNGSLDNHYESTFNYTCTAPLPAGAGNIDEDPQFVDAQDLRLRVGSPCLDLGSNAYATLPTDLLGSPRIQNGTVDMGAYEGGVLATAAPVFDPPSGTAFTVQLVVAVTCATAGVTIRYTLDGSEPTEASTEYVGAFTLTGTATIRARAFKDGYVAAQTSADYMLQVAAPVFSPVSGTSFSMLRKITISCSTEGADIHYTLDGSEPTLGSVLYAGAFNIAETTTVAAKAFKACLADSPTVVATYVKSPSPLDEAMDNTNLVITTGGPANWFPQTTVTHDGVDAARSGAITDGQTTWMQAAVTGPGTLSFWWKASCEDDPDADSWDCLLFTVDGVEQHRLDGITDWSAVTCTLGAGAHALRWEYRKDETLLAGEDCAWVDQLVFNQGLPQTATTTTPVPVPYSWLDQFPTLMSDAGGDYEAAALADVDGDGHAAWQEFVAGSIPTNRESVLRTRISAAGGAPCVTWTPDLGAERAYDVEGRSSVLDGGWGPTNDASRFLRVKVRMP